MSVNFDSERWESIVRNYQLWWAGELERPLIQAVFRGAEPGRSEPALAALPYTSFYDSSVSAEAIVDRWDYDLSCYEYAGDAFPCVCANFGPGIIAAFLGAVLENGEDTVWLHPPKDRELRDICFEYHEPNSWLDRVKDIYRESVKEWDGAVQIAMTDLGANLDILACFRPGDKLLLDLYDHPEDVRQLNWKTHDLWFEYFDQLNGILQPANPGYSSWAGIFSPAPYYMLQCDFSYMIGPDAFNEFVKPELSETCRRLTNSFFHLDGIGSLKHLDALLSIEELGGIQWVPGAGQGPATEWLDIYRKILDNGKLLQLINIDDSSISFAMLDAVVEKLGSGRGIIARVDADISQKDTVMTNLARYDAI